MLHFAKDYPTFQDGRTDSSMQISLCYVCRSSTRMFNIYVGLLAGPLSGEKPNVTQTEEH